MVDDFDGGVGGSKPPIDGPTAQTASLDGVVTATETQYSQNLSPTVEALRQAQRKKDELLGRVTSINETLDKAVEKACRNQHGQISDTASTIYAAIYKVTGFSMYEWQLKRSVRRAQRQIDKLNDESVSLQADLDPTREGSIAKKLQDFEDLRVHYGLAVVECRNMQRAYETEIRGLKEEIAKMQTEQQSGKDYRQLINNRAQRLKKLEREYMGICNDRKIAELELFKTNFTYKALAGEYLVKETTQKNASQAAAVADTHVYVVEQYIKQGQDGVALTTTIKNTEQVTKASEVMGQTANIFGESYSKVTAKQMADNNRIRAQLTQTTLPYQTDLRVQSNAQQVTNDITIDSILHEMGMSTS